MHVGERFYTDDELAGMGFMRIGQNVKIKRNVGLYFTENMIIGNNVRIDDFTIIVASREPIVLGDNTNMAAGCYIAGSEGFIMESFSTFAPHVMIFSGSDDYTGEKLTGATIPKEYQGGPHGKVVVGRHSILGAGTVVLPGVTLGQGTAVGSMSLVTKDTKPWGIYAGVPVRRLRDRSRKVLDLERAYKEETCTR